MSEFNEFYKNLPGNPNWAGSFYEKLAEHGIWDVEAFWHLHFDLIQMAKSNSQMMDRSLTFQIVALYSKISNLIISHYNPEDCFRIIDISSERLHAFMERLEHAILGIFSGEILPETSFDMKNPLI